MDIKSKRLITLGLLLAFTVALPLFVWGIITQRFELREKASVAPTCQPRPNCLDAAPHPCEIPEPDEGWCPTTTTSPTATDDVFFKSEGNSVVFTTTDQNPNISIAPENLIPGKTYVLQVIYSLQNNLKSQNASALKIPIDILIDDVFKSTKEIPYSLIANHRDGASDIQTASFTAQGTNTKLSVLFDPNNIFPETNETNNVLTFNFPRATATSTPTVPPVGGPQGEPNSCGGTCGSKYNCGANFFCFQGFCRNPICPTDTDCACSTPSPTPKPTATPKKTIKPTPTMEIVYVSPYPSVSSSPLPTPTPTDSSGVSSGSPEVAGINPNLNFLLYIAAGSLLGAIILFIINLMKTKRGFAPLALILAVALPVFVWAVATGNFNINKRAASGEPTPTATPRFSPTPTPRNTPTATPAVKPSTKPRPVQTILPPPIKVF